MDIIRIKELQAETELGAYEWEKGVKRPVVVNLVLHVDTPLAGASDLLEDAVDYAVVEDAIIRRLYGASYQLIERLAADIAMLVLTTDRRIAKVEVEVEKPGALKQARCVSVTHVLVRSD